MRPLGSGSGGIRSLGFNHFHKIGGSPLGIRNASFHRWGAADGGVALAEVVVGVMQTDSGLEILPLLAESVGKTGKAAAVHPHGMVLLFDVGGAAKRHVGITLHRVFFNLENIRGRIAASRFEVGMSEGFDNCPVVHGIAEGSFNGVLVGGEWRGSEWRGSVHADSHFLNTDALTSD